MSFSASSRKFQRWMQKNKQLAAQVEAQSLLISALMLAIGEEGGVAELVGNVTKAINSVLESSEDILKSDAELLLTKFQEQIALTQLINTHEDKINQAALGGGEATKRQTRGLSGALLPAKSCRLFAASASTVASVDAALRITRRGGQ